MKKVKKNENYLDYIPVKNYEWREKKNGRVEVVVPHKGFFPWIAQRVFGKPSVSYIELDEYGTALWLWIDGETTILELSEKLNEKFGEKAEPLLDRLVRFMKILQSNCYITYR